MLSQGEKQSLLVGIVDLVFPETQYGTVGAMFQNGTILPVVLLKRLTLTLVRLQAACTIWAMCEFAPITRYSKPLLFVLGPPGLPTVPLYGSAS